MDAQPAIRARLHELSLLLDAEPERQQKGGS